MPVTVTVDAEGGVIRVKYTEPYNFDEWLAGAARFRSHPGAPFNKQLGFLIDRRDVGDLPTAFVAKMLTHLAQSANTMKHRRMAIVVSGHEALQSAWVQAMIYEEAGAIAGVFTCPDEAEAWLKQH